MPENGMTIHHQGKDYFLALAEGQADTLRKFVSVAEDIPAAAAILPDSRRQERTRSLEVYKASASLNDMVPIVADLDETDRMRLNAFLSILAAGRSAGEGRNWIFETIDALLFHVRAEGPFAANEVDPRDALADVAGDIESFWFWINEAKSTLENHPRLHPLRPEPATELSTADTKANPRRARKAKRKAA